MCLVTIPQGSHVTCCRYSSASEQPPQRPQRHSHSGHGGGPISGDYYYRGQEARSSQEYYSQVSRGCSIHLTPILTNTDIYFLQ